ncbi:MAG: hypothetical protein MJ237_08100 [bacterium]|nr:hypothetical protein [bacterium]
MKKFLSLILMFLAIPVFADTMPFYTNMVPKSAIGVYQTDTDLDIYYCPEANSKLAKKYQLSYKQETMPDNMFALLINDKKLGFLYVTDIGDDGWVEVVYDKQLGLKGWVLTSDRLQFLPWINFYNLYGRKYGMKFLKNAPQDLYVLRSKCDDDAQIISKLNYIEQIKLTKISGNWALVTVFDIDRTPKTGWMKWRNSDGTIYAFPNIK